MFFGKNNLNYNILTWIGICGLLITPYYYHYILIKSKFINIEDNSLNFGLLFYTKNLKQNSCLKLLDALNELKKNNSIISNYIMGVIFHTKNKILDLFFTNKQYSTYNDYVDLSDILKNTENKVKNLIIICNRDLPLTELEKIKHYHNKNNLPKFYIILLGHNHYTNFSHLKKYLEVNLIVYENLLKFLTKEEIKLYFTTILKQSKPKKNLTKTPKERLCPICFEEPKIIAFNCGHIICEKCQEKLKNCPFCRTKITQRIKLFL